MQTTKNSIEAPICFEDIDDSSRFFIFGEGPEANLLHALLAGKYGTRFFGYLSLKNDNITTDTRTSYPINRLRDFMPSLKEGDFVFLIERSEKYEQRLLDQGVRVGHSYFFVHSTITYEIPAFNHFLKQHFSSRNNNHIGLDIGANFGITCAMMSRHFDKLIAFEPQKRIYHSLINNEMLPKNISFESIAFGDKPGCLKFFESPDRGNGSLQEVLFEGGDSYAVDVTTIDNYCQQHNIRPDLIKIDAEGVDLKIIKGAAKTIEIGQPILYFENPIVSPLTFDEDEFSETLDFLSHYYTLLAYPGLNQPFPHERLGTDYFKFIEECELKSPLNIGAVPK